jgi:hypothetical protein
MMRPFMALAIVLVARPAFAQATGSMGTGTSSSDTTGLQTSVPNAVHEQSSGSSMNAPPGQGGSTASGSTDTGTGPGNTTGAQTSIGSAVQNQTPQGSPPTR